MEKDARLQLRREASQHAQDRLSEGEVVTTPDLYALNKAVQASSTNPATKAWINAATPLIQPTPPPPWSVAPPRPPITDATNPTGIGLNVPSGGAQTFEDYVSAGTFDSGVIVGPAASGTIFQRFNFQHAASIGTGPRWGRHFLYCKSPNITALDITASMDPNAPNCGQIFSIRYAGFHAERFNVAGLFLAAFFDDDPNHRPGPALLRDGIAAFVSSDGAMFSDATLQYTITLDTLTLTGPSDVIFHVDAGTTPPIIVCQAVTINGKPAAPAMFQGVPAGNLHIS